jgi:hypothetical protein
MSAQVHVHTKVQQVQHTNTKVQHEYNIKLTSSLPPPMLPPMLAPILPQDTKKLKREREIQDTEKLKREREMLQLRLEAYELLEKAEIQFLLELAKKKKKRKSERKRETNRLRLESQQVLGSLQQRLEADSLIPLKLILKLLLEEEVEKEEEEEEEEVEVLEEEKIRVTTG